MYVLFHILFHYGFPQGIEYSSLCYTVGKRVSVSHSVVSDSLRPHWLKCTRLLRLWDSNQARILEWVAIPFSSGSSWPRDRTQVSCIAGRFSTTGATREAPLYISMYLFFLSFFSHLGSYIISSRVSYHSFYYIPPLVAWHCRDHKDEHSLPFNFVV